MGELYWFQLPLLILGLIFLIKKTKPEGQILFLWLTLYPLGSTLAAKADGGGPFATRSIIGVIPLQIISALGLLLIITMVKKISLPILNKAFIFILFAVLLSAVSFLSFKSYLHQYFNNYALYSSDFWGWQYGPRDVISYFKEQADYYDDLFLMGNFNAPEIFFKFYDPQNTCQGKCRIGGLVNYFPARKQLFAIGTSRLSEIPPYLLIEEKHAILYPNRKPAFIIGVLKTNPKYGQ